MAALGLVVADESDKRLLAVIRECASVQTAAAFQAFMEGPFCDVFPHEIMLSGIHLMTDQGNQIHRMLSRNYPRAYFDAIHTAGKVDTPLTKKWKMSLAPEGFQSGRDDQDFPAEWVSLFNRFDLCNVIGHGVPDIAGTLGSFFLFYRIPGQLGPEHTSILKIMTPHLHLAMMRAAPTMEGNHQNLNAAGKGLNERQRQILRWLQEGKTNWEIARILDITERGVKYHIKHIYEHLEVHNRAQAVAKANALGLLHPVRA